MSSCFVPWLLKHSVDSLWLTPHQVVAFHKHTPLTVSTPNLLLSSDASNFLDSRTLDLWQYLHTKPLHHEGRVMSLHKQREKSETHEETMTHLLPGLSQVISEGVTDGITRALAQWRQREVLEEE